MSTALRTGVAVSLCLLAGFTARPERPRAAPQAVFHGEMPGGTVRDATRVDSTIYAVGTWINTSAGRTDGALWTLDGTNPPTRTALPDICSTCGIQALQAGEAITADGAYIASHARTGTAANALTAVRVSRSPLANLNLTPTAVANPKLAKTISDDGSVIYGNLSMTVAGSSIFRPRAVRFDINGGAATPIYPQPAQDASGFTISQGVVPRGASSNGNVVVGQSFTDRPEVDTQAFRYVRNVGTSTIPRLPGGTFNSPIALNGAGNLVALAGNSTEFPNNEAYVYNAVTSAITRLGSPNAAWTIRSVGGMTDDGGVVVATAAGSCVQPCTPDTYAYFHNGHGWFHLTSALGEAGIDMSEWRNLQAFGMNGDGTLVWGTGERNGAREGFVVEFAPGYLANFNPPTVPPANTSIVGVWSEDELGAETHFVVFTADGAYFQVEDEKGGFERGSYTFDGQTLSLVTRLDTNGSRGLSDLNGTPTALSVSGDTLGPMHRIAGARGSIAGAWIAGDPTAPDSSMLVVFTGNTYGTAFDFDDHSSETGTYTWDPSSRVLNVFPTIGPPDFGNQATPSADGLTMLLIDDGGEEFTLNRIVDPATVPSIANTPLSAPGVAGVTFNYGVTATNTASFEATGLPDGLSIDSGTGQISGTPSVGGQFAVTIVATNTNGVSDIQILTLTISIPTPVGTNVTVQPVVPEGQGPVTVSFGEVTAAGTTTVTVLENSAVPPPGSVEVGGVIYEVTTTASYQGLITLCFSYAGIDFDTATPQLFHYENNVWVDVTTSVDPATQTICGATTSLSPFAVLVSHVVRKGFYSPVNPIAGYLNLVNGGRTVPLKFNIFVDGVEQTTIAGLAMTVQPIKCDSSAPLDAVEPAAVSGAAALRYDAAAGYFVQNWKVPTTPGCYMVRMTTAQDGLALTARFKVK